MKKIKFIFDYNFQNLNDIIKASRGNYRYANIKKREEMEFIKYSVIGEEKVKNYPVNMTFIWHVKDKNRDLDNLVGKHIIDGLVKAKILKNDNLNCINEINYKAIIDKDTYLELIIEEKED